MILPTKHLAQDRALLSVGAKILPSLDEPITVSALWEQLSRDSTSLTSQNSLRYDAFVLALDLLFVLGTIELNDGLITRAKP
jgi:hypothetical protein